MQHLRKIDLKRVLPPTRSTAGLLLLKMFRIKDKKKDNSNRPDPCPQEVPPVSIITDDY